MLVSLKLFFILNWDNRFMKTIIYRDNEDVYAPNEWLIVMYYVERVNDIKMLQLNIT